MAILRERVEAMKAIWTEDEASYAGEHVSFERIWSWPKPARWPHPPVLVGGNGPGVLDRVLAFGDA
jgi:alkanesulfonate monooxygenase SsuD/methylene tetrahydromethanopterin reductase-like flavin-dependent oxidoreductase (luciferase family)